MRNGRWVAMQFAEKGLEEGHMTPTDAVSIGSTVAARSQVLVLFTIWRADCNKRKRGRERGRERERECVCVCQKKQTQEPKLFIFWLSQTSTYHVPSSGRTAFAGVGSAVSASTTSAINATSSCCRRIFLPSCFLRFLVVCFSCRFLFGQSAGSCRV